MDYYKKKGLKNNEDEKVPLFRSWKVWYALVLGVLVLLIFLFYLVTQYFA